MFGGNRPGRTRFGSCVYWRILAAAKSAGGASSFAGIVYGDSQPEFKG